MDALLGLVLDDPRATFDDAGLLRRMDYQPDVNGRTPVAHYIRREGMFDGIVVPTRRHIHPATKTGPRTCRRPRSRWSSATSSSDNGT